PEVFTIDVELIGSGDARPNAESNAFRTREYTLNQDTDVSIELAGAIPVTIPHGINQATVSVKMYTGADEDNAVTVHQTISVSSVAGAVRPVDVRVGLDIGHEAPALTNEEVRLSVDFKLVASQDRDCQV